MKTIDILFLLFIIAAASFVEIGFFHPDHYLFIRYGAKFKIVIWAIRFFVPLLFAGCTLFYFSLRTRRLKPTDAVLIVTSIILTGLLCLGAASWLYNKKSGIDTIVSTYHPYLQLKPPLPDSGYLNIKKGKRTLSIFCCGGSTTEFTNTFGKGWPELAEIQLSHSVPDITFDFQNLGRKWYTSLHTLINFETNLRYHHPDAVIIMHAINDLLHNADESYFSHGEFRPDYGHFYGPINRLMSYRGLLDELSSKARIWYWKPREIIEAESFWGLVPFERNLNTLIDLAEKDGIAVILMTQPTLFKPEMSEQEQDVLYMVNIETCGPRTKWSYQTACRGMDAYNQKVRDIARDRHCFLIDLEKVVPKSLDYFWDDVHYTDTTFSLIGDYVTNEIMQKELLDTLMQKHVMNDTLSRLQ